MSNITVEIVTTYAEVVEAVRRHRYVAILNSDNGVEIKGRLRHITSGEGTAAYLPAGGDLRSAWVRITTRQGPDVWMSFLDLVQARAESRASWNI